ncbi:DUF1667 domain-containing protein [Treponema sp. HNW]|uniref:DUF1667 domain-containing protein n=1 Tax=Treponema sp. HNW TaxID=3116654 RepID=UPI003D0D433A
MTKHIICIACPRGCRLSLHIKDTADNPPAEQDIEVSGNSCPKGILYGRQELICPVRTLTTTISCTLDADKPFSDRRHIRLPVKTVCEIPLKDTALTIRKIHDIRLTRAVNCGDIIAVLKGEDGSKIPLAACASTEENV